MIRARAFLRNFGRARGGATAVEFAFVAGPFVALLFATLELGLVFLAQNTLDNATDDAARHIRTGQLQAVGGTPETFKVLVCSEMTWLEQSCTTNLDVDVRTFTTFTKQNNDTKDAVFDPTKLTFQPGAGQDIVLVRTYYKWTLITPFLNQGLVNLGNNKRLITSMATFRNEPFSSGPPAAGGN
jgi:Flp pilus assembly protein TadG